MFARQAEAQGRGARDRDARGSGQRPVTTLAALAPDSDFVRAAYIVAFVLFIVGVKQGTHPTTAKRGNLVAAGGMAVAIVVTLCLDGHRQLGAARSAD